MFSLPLVARACIAFWVLGCSACTGIRAKPDMPATQTFYTVTAEIALARHEPRVAAIEYAAAASNEDDPRLLQRAAVVAADGQQPAIAATVAARWIRVDPSSLDAQRTAARAALSLHRIDEATAHYREVLKNSPLSLDAEFGSLEADFTGGDNIFGARQVADRLALAFPGSTAALRVQGLAALRADDPASAVRSLSSALEQPAEVAPQVDEAAANARRTLAQTLLRARVLAGDVDAPLAQLQSQLATVPSPANRFDFAVLLMTAQRYDAASEQFELLAKDPDSAAASLRLLGLIQLQQGHLDAASGRFTQLLRIGQLSDDGFYYLGVIADRHGELETALRLYAQVQSGDNVVPALLRASSILHNHGGGPAADELFDRLLEDEPQRAPEILTARARMYADAGDYRRALSILQNAGLEYPDSVEVRYAKASLYEDSGELKAALRELRRLLASRPDDPAALNALGFTLADHNKELPRARLMIERAYRSAPKNAAILDSLGWVLFRQGQAEAALPYLSIAYADDHSGDIAAHLGEVLWHLGNATEADRVWSEAGTVDADNRLLNATRQRLHGVH